jgi:hypothetical protein
VIEARAISADTGKVNVTEDSMPGTAQRMRALNDHIAEVDKIVEVTALLLLVTTIALLCALSLYTAALISTAAFVALVTKLPKRFRMIEHRRRIRDARLGTCRSTPV